MSSLQSTVPEFIDPVFAKTSRKRSFSMTENARFGLVFAKTRSINSGTVLYCTLNIQYRTCLKKRRRYTIKSCTFSERKGSKNCIRMHFKKYFTYFYLNSPSMEYVPLKLTGTLKMRKF